MRSKMLERLILVAAILAVPVVGHAQEATVLGQVTDVTGGVLPGVTITVTHEASGNRFSAVTNERGEYRIPVRTGVNRIAAELAGFNPVNRTLDLLLGQQAVMNLQMAPAGVAEAVTVSAEAPLLDVVQSKLGGNIDPRQMQGLPIQGRNFLDLAMLVPGGRGNMVGDTPFGQAGSAQVGFGSFQLNIDGQQITQNVSGTGVGGNPRFSQDAIGEFQVVSRFDATQGRSAGVQVNVISKSGTNTRSGTFSSYFRDDSMIAKDFIAHAVLPYSNQQMAGTYGGPIRKDKAHYFINYEYEREPGTFVYQSTGATAAFNRNLSGTRKERKGDARLDLQLSERSHLTIRGNNWRNAIPYDQASSFGPASAVNAPTSAVRTDRYSDQIHASLTNVITNRALNEVKVGHSGQHWYSRSVLSDWVGGPNTFAGPRAPGSGVTNITFSGYSIGTTTQIPQRIGQDVYNIRDDFTYLYGHHNLKTGGEYQNYLVWHEGWCTFFNGQLSFPGKPPDDIASFFPDIMNPATWDLVGLSLEVPPTSYQGMVGDCSIRSPRNVFSAWLQDDWQISPRLTLNLGLRWDGETGTWAPEIGIPPFLPANRSNPLNNWGPRLGGAYKLNDRTVLRGGWGVYYSEVINQTGHNTRIDNQQLRINTQNTAKRPDFAVNPYNGPTPTFDQALASFCSTQHVLSNCVLRSFSSSMVSPYQKIPRSYQASIGIQRQLADTMAAEANVVWTGLRGDRITTPQTNLVFDPTTGVNIPFSTALTPAGNASRAYPEFGVVPIDWSNGVSDYKALETSFTKRFSHRWQMQATYTLAYFYDAQAAAMTGPNEVPFKVADDLGYQYTLAATDQRHRATFNTIWELGYGFQLSGLYFFGSGQRFATTCGADNRGIGVPSSTGYLLCSAAVMANPPAGVQFEPGTAILVRNQFVGRPIHRVDIRLMRQFKLGARARVGGTLDVYNLFNHANYGNYTTIVTNPAYGQPSQVANVVFNPRTVQFGFRLAF